MPTALDALALSGLIRSIKVLPRLRCLDCYTRTIYKLFEHALKAKDFDVILAAISLAEAVIKKHTHKSLISYCFCPSCARVRRILFNQKVAALTFCCLTAVPPTLEAMPVIAFAQYVVFVKPTPAKIDQYWGLVELKGRFSPSRLTFLANVVYVCDSLHYAPPWLENVSIDAYSKALHNRLQEVRHLDVSKLLARTEELYADMGRKAEVESAGMQFTKDELEAFYSNCTEI